MTRSPKPIQSRSRLAELVVQPRGVACPTARVQVQVIGRAGDRWAGRAGWQCGRACCAPAGRHGHTRGVAGLRTWGLTGSRSPGGGGPGPGRADRSARTPRTHSRGPVLAPAHHRQAGPVSRSESCRPRPLESIIRNSRCSLILPFTFVCVRARVTVTVWVCVCGLCAGGVLPRVG